MDVEFSKKPGKKEGIWKEKEQMGGKIKMNVEDTDWMRWRGVDWIHLV